MSNNNKSKCKIKDCDRYRVYKKLEVCKMHYKRYARTGSFELIKKLQIANTHELYTTWSSMKSRCYHEHDDTYKYYGGRGIKICDRWLEPNAVGFWNFVKDMGDRPTPKHSIDRIDNDGNYKPSNCRWADQTVQRLNSRARSDNRSGHSGVCYRKQDRVWQAYITIRGKTTSLGSYKDKSDAIQARKKAEGELSFEGGEGYL